MRTFLAATIAIALLSAPAYAQDTWSGKRHQRSTQKTEKTAKKKISDKEFNDALAKIPDSKEPRDPWRNMRK